MSEELINDMPWTCSLVDERVWSGAVSYTQPRLKCNVCQQLIGDYVVNDTEFWNKATEYAARHHAINAWDYYSDDLELDQIATLSAFDNCFPRHAICVSINHEEKKYHLILRVETHPLTFETYLHMGSEKTDGEVQDVFNLMDKALSASTDLEHEERNALWNRGS